MEKYIYEMEYKGVIYNFTYTDPELDRHIKAPRYKGTISYYIPNIRAKSTTLYYHIRIDEVPSLQNKAIEDIKKDIDSKEKTPSSSKEKGC